MAAKRPNYFWTVLQATIVGILALTAVIMGAVFFFAENDPFMLALALAGAVISFFCVKWIFRANEGMKAQIRANAAAEHDFITSWEIGNAEWSAFLDEQEKQDNSDTRAIAGWSAGLTAVIAGFPIYSAMDNKPLAIGLSLLCGLAVWILVKMARNAAIGKRNRQFRRDGTAIVLFARKCVLINEHVIFFNQYMTSLKGIRLDESRRVPTLVFSIRTDAGRRSQTHDHYVPVADEHLDEARKLLEFYTDIQS